MQLPKIEGRFIDPAFIGELKNTETLYHFECVDLIYTTTLPSGHRAFVFWSDCTDDSMYDRYLVYVFRDVRFDWAYERIKIKNELLVPILEEADWIYAVDFLNTKEGAKIEKITVVDWVHLKKGDIPGDEARLYTETEHAQVSAAIAESRTLDSERREEGADGAGVSPEPAGS